MAVITLILGSVGFFVAGFAAWYTVLRRRAFRFERVPVKSWRPPRVLREGVELGRDLDQ
jgi:hypothetical protein